MTCPNCGLSEHVLVMQTLRKPDGVHRRMVCTVCDHRWNQLDGDAPRQKRTGKLTEDQVREILLARDVNHASMARRFHKTLQAIRHIRYGWSYRDFCPEVERWDQGIGHATCTLCCHWRRESCGFGFPDPLEEGLTFARECLHFRKT